MRHPQQPPPTTQSIANGLIITVHFQRAAAAQKYCQVAQNGKLRKNCCENTSSV